MDKRIWLLFVIIVLTLSTGCDTLLSGLSQPTPAGPSLDELSTLSAMFTQSYTTPTLEIADPLLLTNTPELGQGGDNLVSTLTPTPTKTTQPGSIKIISITQKSPGVAIVKWEAAGDFPSGFKIVFSELQGQPSYPEDTYTSIYSSTARAGVINYSADRIYYVRVCRFKGDSCDLYSDLGIFAFAPPTKTPKPTKTAAIVNINGTEVPFDPSLEITMMKGGVDGKAYVAWKDSSSNSKPYRIVYSSTAKVPTLGTDPYFSISDSKVRSAYVNGASGASYNYRICHFIDNTCASYSKIYKFTFPSYTVTDNSTITITSITNSGTGTALVNWNASGTFSSGFKILYSKTNSSPTLSDNVSVVSDGSARVGSISGDPSSQYHVRVCKYSGSECTIYSNVVDFTFDADPIAINLSSVLDGVAAGEMDLTWSISGGTTPNGFKILKSTNATPDLSNSTIFTADNGDTTATISGDPSTLYYLRICKSLVSTCGAYSNIVTFTTDGS